MSDAFEVLPSTEPGPTPTGRQVLTRIYTLATEEQKHLNPNSVADFIRTMLDNRLPSVEQTDAMIESATVIGRFTVLHQLLQEFVPDVTDGPAGQTWAPASGGGR
jgi:hypothetical protein